MTPLFLGPLQAQLLPVMSDLICAALKTVGVAVICGSSAKGGGVLIDEDGGAAESLNKFIFAQALSAEAAAIKIIFCVVVFIIRFPSLE